MAKERTRPGERVTTLSPVVDDGQGQNTSVNPSFVDVPTDPIGLIPQPKGKEK